MAEEYKCEFCGKPFRTLQALAGYTRMKHPRSLDEGETGKPRVKAREVPIVEQDFTTPELLRGKGMDIMRKAIYVACDKSAPRRLSEGR